MWSAGRLHPIIPGPGDVTLRPRPGSLFDYFAGKSTKADLAEMLSCEVPSEHPGVVRPRRPTEVYGRAGRRGVLVVPVAGRLHGGSDAARCRGVDRHLPRLQSLARGGLGLRLPGPDLRRPVPHPVRPRQCGPRAGVGDRPWRACGHDPQRAGVHARGDEVAGRPDVRPLLGTRRRGARRRGAARGLRRRLPRGRERRRSRLGLPQWPPRRRHQCRSRSASRSSAR